MRLLRATLFVLLLTFADSSRLQLEKDVKNPFKDHFKSKEENPFKKHFGNKGKKLA